VSARRPNRPAVLAAALAWPATCFASEASLFVVLFGMPSLLLAIVFAAVALKAPRGGAVLCGMLLISVVPLVFWAHRGGFLDSAGWLLLPAIGIAALGLLVGVARLARTARDSPTKDGNP
jgi:hypothetical protein